MAFFQRINWKDDGEFLIRIASLLEKGFSLDASISYLSITSPKYSKRYEQIIRSLALGNSFSFALSQNGFPEFICSQLHYASSHGYFTQTIHETGIHMKRKSEEKSALMKTFQYPLVLFSTVIVVFFLLRIFLLPKFELLFSQLSSNGSLGTTFTYFLLEKVPILLGLFLLSLFLLVSLIIRKQNQKNAYDRAYFYCRIPYIRQFLRIHYSQSFSRELGYLLKSGLSITHIMQLFAQEESPAFFQAIAQRILPTLEQGLSLTKALEKMPIFEKELYYIAIHGEKNGNLAEEFLFYYNLCHQKSLQKTEKLFSFIQPIVFIIIGILIVSIYLSILYPMFSMVNQI
ncbi:competence type IV pilus assembly protein ComGB [Listeria cossartiae subsp. cayugensis]|uniref:Type II secretion system F family protein n=1 Tax=Listeria cossartiae subsp. cayugensis TaxID=2713505 RepID=A0A7X0ZBI5_9LIST|nr:competence type IV pilus assembly protein ComGB [Listeria cossartiae]MBC2249416.1 type II secretion system F family protein [Listeria cossartiae subsp. cayugensis]MDT0002968.1 competence type IV pilus assembly protein ComGB [Listeria cossartiae subsp. cayugensis]MDT0018664.1 competence type IV pilus assembly protein ComGB [Listeria cossartiae subsp. cayugensis]MDT0035763.1 competence type IV pilus assembly protein ComGB [Listeria cossartiae subsp. cayugensis]MDT0040414.1 competence type IV 